MPDLLGDLACFKNLGRTSAQTFPPFYSQLITCLAPEFVFCPPTFDATDALGDLVPALPFQLIALVKMMSRLFLVALLAVLGVVSGFAPVANTASVVGKLSRVPEEGEEREKGTPRHRIDGANGPSVVYRDGEEMI